MIGNVLAALVTSRNVLSFAPAVNNFRLVPLRVDLNFEIVSGLSGRDLRNDFHRLAGGQHSIHAGSADADTLLAAAHPQAVELGSIKKFPEDQRDLFLDD